jgi:3-deoxy-D-manno-octulosonic-acid transferase
LHGPHVSNFIEIYDHLKKLEITRQINSSNELSLLLVEEFKKDKPKNQEIASKIENYGENILNNVIAELKKYI